MQVASNHQFGTLTQFLPLFESQHAGSAENSASLGSAAFSVAILEGNASLARLLARGFSAESIKVQVHHDLDSVMQHLETKASDLLILDLDMEGINGLELLAKLRLVQPSMRVLVLSGRAGVERAVEVLDRGADDYLIKPFSLLEMMARVRALRRRSGDVVHAPKLLTGGLVLHRDQCRVSWNGHAVDLTPRECELLDFMMMYPGMTLSRATLCQRVWNMSAEASTNIVDVYVKYLRDKLENAYHQKLIRTVRGVGYVFQHQS